MNHKLQHYNSLPSTKPNSINMAESRTKDLSFTLKERSCNTPESPYHHFNLYLDKYWSEKPRPASSMGPSRRHYSLVNQTCTSPGEIYKENIPQYSNRNYRRYLGDFERLEENPSDEERTCHEQPSRKNSYFGQNSSNVSSEYNIQMEDSFYKRFSELKHRPPVQAFHDLESRSDRGKLSADRCIPVHAVNLKQSLQTKKILTNKITTTLLKNDKKPLTVNPSKKTFTLPYQPQPHKIQRSGTEGTLNYAKKRVSTRYKDEEKENKKPTQNISQRTPVGTYEEILKKCLSKKSEFVNVYSTPYSSNNIHTVTNTPKSGSKGLGLLQARPTSSNSSSSKPKTSRNKTFFIGNNPHNDSLKIVEESEYDNKVTFSLSKHPLIFTPKTFILPTDPSDNKRIEPISRNKTTLKEVISNQVRARRPAPASKVNTSPSPLKYLTDRSFSNPKTRVHNRVSAVNESMSHRPVAPIAPQSLKELKFEQIVGQGAYAVVKMAVDRGSGKHVAVKIYEKAKLTDPARMRNVRREITLLKEMHHPNIIKLHSSIETPKQIHLVMEFVGKASLQNYLKTKLTRRLEENVAKKIFAQICQGISYCHNKNIIHRDIKLDNILLDNEHNVKIIDFGFSINVAQDKCLGIFCGTPCYMSPEIVSKQQYKGPPSDVWALGIVLYTLLCGKFPFRGFDEKDLFGKIRKGKYDVPGHLSSGAFLLLDRILKVRPSERLTVDEILEDAWLRY